MGKIGKILGFGLLGLGVVCIGLYFVFSNTNKSYVVSFDTLGGSLINNQTINEGEYAKKPTDPTKENNVFLGWTLNGKTYDFQKAILEDTKLVANWKEVYTVVTTLEGTEYSVLLDKGEKVEISKFNFPEKEGYGIKLYDSDDFEYDLTKEVNSNLNLTAKYYALKSFKVRFNTNGASKLNSVTVWEGKTVTMPTITRVGYELDGWYLGNNKYDFSTPVTSDMTLVAHWTEKGKLKVTFNVDDKEYRVREVKENAKVTAPTTPTKKGFVFVEWQLNGKTYNFNNPVTQNMTLEAVFREAKTFTVKFNTNSDTKIKDVSVSEGNKVSEPTKPTKSGYTFIGWTLNNQLYNFNSSVKSDMTLVAKWELDVPKYKVIFKSDGETIATKEVKKGDKIEEPSKPQKSGYRFIEWRLDGVKYDFTKAIESDITLTAEWQELELFRVTFDCGNGQCIRSQDIRDGEKAIMVTPQRDGYEFIEWQLDGKKYDFNTPVTKAITLTALWRQK